VKKVYQIGALKRWQRKKSQKGVTKRKKNFSPKVNPNKWSARKIGKPKSFTAPTIFSIYKNPEETLQFFIQLRNPKNWVNSSIRGVQKIKADLSDVTELDFSTISILHTISDDLSVRGVNLHGKIPTDPTYNLLFREHGIFNHKYDMDGKPFPKQEKTGMMFINKGGKLTNHQQQNIANEVRNIVGHLTGEKKPFSSLRSLFMEMCGNTIEWSNSQDRKWLFATKYEEERVICTFTDVGLGILETLQRKFLTKINELGLYENAEILLRAFEKRYQSSSGELNRNKGLPAIKKSFDDGLISELRILSNNVLLLLDKEDSQHTFSRGTTFNGTFYRLVITKSNIEKK